LKDDSAKNGLYRLKNNPGNISGMEDCNTRSASFLYGRLPKFYPKKSKKKAA